uniref:hypothetical protein n=1 Tax=Flavobacterium sp. TaxID=239 RepID=UPI004048BA19
MIKTKLVVVVCFFISSLTVFSQEIQEDVKGKDFIIKDLKSLSFYGGTIFQFTTLDNDFSFFVGGKGGVAFNRKVLLGFEGYTLKSSNTSKDNHSKELSFTKHKDNKILKIAIIRCRKKINTISFKTVQFSFILSDKINFGKK